MHDEGGAEHLQGGHSDEGALVFQDKGEANRQGVAVRHGEDLQHIIIYIINLL